MIFPYIGNNHPNWRIHIFQGGSYTTNQIMWIQLARDWCIQCRLWLCVFQHSPTGFLGMMVPTYFSIDFCCVSMFFELYCIDMLLLYTWCHICLNMYTDNCMLYIYIYVYTRMMHVCVYIYMYAYTYPHIQFSNLNDPDVGPCFQRRPHDLWPKSRQHSNFGTSFL